jgi:hypothetical protein
LIGRFCALREDVLSFALSAYVAELIEVHPTRNFTTKIIFKGIGGHAAPRFRK